MTSRELRMRSVKLRKLSKLIGDSFQGMKGNTHSVSRQENRLNKPRKRPIEICRVWGHAILRMKDKDSCHTIRSTALSWHLGSITDNQEHSTTTILKHSILPSLILTRKPTSHLAATRDAEFTNLTIFNSKIDLVFIELLIFNQIPLTIWTNFLLI